MARAQGSFFTRFFKHKDLPTDPASKNCSTKSQQHNGVTWIDIHDPSKESLTKIGQEYNLQEIHIDQCLQKTQITQMEVTDDYIFLLFYFPFFIPQENRIATSQVNVFLGKKFLLTLHDASNRQIVDQLFREYQDNPVEAAKTPGKILYKFINYLLKDTGILIQQVQEELDQVEDRVFANTGSQAQQIGQLRQKIVRLRRTIAMQKSLLDELDAAIDRFTGDRLAPYYSSNTKTSRKMSETIEEAKETIEIFKDADYITSTEKTNDILAVLTLLFTLTIPATVLGTFYGMNILLPGGIDSGSWTFLGNFTALKLILIISLASALLMYLYFRRKKWF